MKKLYKEGLWLTLSVVMSMLLIVAMILNSLGQKYYALINGELGLQPYTVTGLDDDVTYFEAKYKTADEIHDRASEVSELLEQEGMVLLKNEENTLPLAKDAKVSLFGSGSVNINCSQQGARESSDKENYPTFRAALEAVGVTVNDKLWNFYSTGAGAGYGGYKKLDSETNLQISYINEVPWDEVNTSVGESFANFGDAAIMVITRDGTEGADLSAAGSDGANGNYLALSKEEKETLQQLSSLKAQGIFQHVIVVLNSASAVQLDFLEDESIAVDACLWIGNTGMSGIQAVAKVMTNYEGASPSGKLSDTYVYDNFSSPAMASWVLNENAKFSNHYEDSALTDVTSYYGVYVEGIYVGYRYYETRYADVVEGRSGVGNYEYGATVAYPFGYGMSYTDFSYSDFDVTETADGNGYEVAVTVTNTGTSYSGKESVQIYLQKPYTEYDIENQIEIPAAELVGFAKTQILAPGESEVLTVSVSKEDFTSYDVYGYETYILEAGNYYLAAGTNAHDALNNILAYKGYTTENGMDYEGDRSLVFETSVETTDAETYSVSSITGNTITNQLENGDMNRYVGGGSNITQYVSRNAWEETWPNQKSIFQLNDAILADLGNKSIENVENTDNLGIPDYSQKGNLALIQLRGLEYEDPLWEELLDQMSFEDQNTLLTTAYGITAAVESVVKPQSKEMDGPTVAKYGLTGSRFPNEGIWASTFNTELLHDVGEILANDAIFAGYTGLWGMAVNIHRTPYGGRSHEYFSEDPYLSGVMAAHEIQGVQEYGIVAGAKHFVFNDQETNRNGIAIWLNEQAAREIYLEPWKYVVSPSAGNAHSVMSSFNRIGNTWTSASKELITNILRGEFGFDGYVITDLANANGTSYMTTLDGILAGTDCWLSSSTEHTFVPYQNNAVVTNAMRDACHRILYTICNNSIAMNGYSENTQIVVAIMWWEKLAMGLLIGFAVLSAISIVMYGLSKYQRVKADKQR